ncbi:unnamed protein product [Peronospora belbahrii]|uniref:HTH psq-type domain-containing protein n=1 Tax=Peronospora belbahrii TaxID=622444 RepID=A0ABN8CS64_9STRA|nr:unnamed protein product [Peronospora belbahrii]
MSLSLLTMDTKRQRPIETSCTEVRHYLTKTDEQEALDVLRDQFWHDQKCITSNDVRSVVRAVANRRSTTSLPLDFPPMCWIHEFKRVHGFAHAGGIFAVGLPGCLSTSSRSSSITRATSTSPVSGDSSDDDERGGNEQSLRCYDTARNSDTLMRFNMRSTYESESQMEHTRQQQKQRRSLVIDNHRAQSAWTQCDQTWGRNELGISASSGSCGSGDSENGTTTGASSSSSVTTAPSTASSDNKMYSCAAPGTREPTFSAKRGYKLSHTVSPETWEKAIASVEQQGMSLRAAAKIYGVHFAALHRRVKKRAQGGQSSKDTSGYFHQSDEAGIMRVVVARAELGVLMTFNELMNLVEATALRKLPDISVANARKLMARFQSRNEKSVWHIIVDWPSPALTKSSSPVVNHHYLEHPGYDTESLCSSSASMQRAFSAHAAVGSATAAVAPALPLHISLLSSSIGGSTSSINGNRPMLPSLNVSVKFSRPLVPQQQEQL